MQVRFLSAALVDMVFMPTTTEDLFYGGFSITTVDRPARCKGDFNCNTYGLAPEDSFEVALTIPKGEIALFVYGKDHQPLIYCKEHMKIVFREMEKTLKEAKKLKLR